MVQLTNSTCLSIIIKAVSGATGTIERARCIGAQLLAVVSPKQTLINICTTEYIHRNICIQKTYLSFHSVFCGITSSELCGSRNQTSFRNNSAYKGYSCEWGRPAFILALIYRSIDARSSYTQFSMQLHLYDLTVIVQ